MKHKIITLTINPAVDKSTKFSGMVAEQKLRCESPVFDAGGGGINVSKAITRLGGKSLAIFTSGGHTGNLLQDLVLKENIEYQVVTTKEWTRENFIAVDTATNAQYRFGMPGQNISEEESNQILEEIKNLKPEILVASGSLLPNIGDDFYEKIASIARKIGSKLVIDTSGEALKRAVDEGVHLLKPNISELAKLVGASNLELGDVDDAARLLIANGGCEIVVVSLGPQGAILITKDFHEMIPAPPVQKKSTVGAGDSMVGGMVWAISENKNLSEMLRWGVACGSAATMNEGTKLFKKEDAIRLFEWLKSK